ncbi:dystrobrevin alpha isoform X1 [Frankliniella occidentalis]|uniref:Dystrobrevin n=1 Tax=Frankliniella occidentalis TaxID=133901 RepID=A0A6J1SM53_FRAOC|nr:dystrobrevin alpha isoform X1 [Frankliniella occidentalis]XP_026282379.1 dystrobrevin alpha isoform X1 [Frankliniella occidentalis]XP_052124922.1 dystrobrevin alpha isoform X1 [Frankliniella occidentalis]
MGEEGASGSEHHRLLSEMRAQNLDMIRFASYRTACKLRFVQKKANLHQVDIWNVIEAFRENGLNTLEPQMEVNVSRLETLISSLYHNLNKRLPPAQQVHAESSSGLLLNWLLSAYSAENTGKIRVFSIKVALATMCAGKLMDKLRYIFSQISDGNGQLVIWRFEDYLREVLALPAAVFESPSFHYSSDLSAKIFVGSQKVTVNDFMDTMMSDPGPACLVWLPLLHRLAGVESVVHPITCDACHRENFSGFRYRCQKCHNFQMCQDCFWRGRIFGSHTNEHEVKEYTSYKSPSKQIGHTLRKSFRCVPEKGRPNIPRFPEEPEKTLNLSHIVPPSPLPSHNGFPESSFMSTQFDVGSMDSRSTTRSPGKYSSSLDSSRYDDEHRLIARYAARLAAEARTVPRHSSRSSMHIPDLGGRAPSEGSLSLDSSRVQRELIAQLEAKNKEIVREIKRLKIQQDLENAALGSEGSSADNPALMSELRALRQRKDELEGHLSSLQDSRRQLMVQLEGLMKLLKNHQASPRSTPNSSPRSTKSPPLTGSLPGTLTSCASSRSAPPTPGSQQLLLGSATELSLGSDMRATFGNSTNALSNFHAGSSASLTRADRSLRNDLLVAADSVTNAMSTLVRELNSGTVEVFL